MVTEALQPRVARNIPHCGRSQEICSAARQRAVRRAHAPATERAERSAAALVRSGLICYIERRRFGARPRGPRSFAVVAELVDALACGGSGATRGGSSPLDRTTTRDFSL